MTREEAEKLVDELVDATINYEQNCGFAGKYYRQDREEAREKVIAALTSAQRSQE